MYYVAAGMINISEIDQHSRYPVAAVRIHPDRDKVKFKNDLAVVKLAKPLDLEKHNIAPICLGSINKESMFHINDTVKIIKLRLQRELDSIVTKS